MPRLWLAGLLASLIAFAVVIPAGADQDSGGAHSRSPSSKAQGLMYDGFQEKDRGPCRHGYRVEVPGTETPICSHGPDPAPDGIDVRDFRDVSDLGSTATGTSVVPCVGDGVSGPRVQAIYAVASNVFDRYTGISSLIAGWAGQVDAALNQSAAETGGERHIRFVTNPDCSLNIAHVVLSPTGDDTFANTITELRNLGYGQGNRKYLIWFDANVYCGVAQSISDDIPGAMNLNNTTSEYARVDSGCWGRSDHLSELHELMHTLGAVQTTAPHATAAHHCTDEYDAMCYQDAPGVTLTVICPSSHEWLLDCGHDDYFNTAPSAGSYLATHWNLADSTFLTTTLGSSSPSPTTSPSPSPSSSPSLTATPSSSPTSTTTVSPTPTPTVSPTPTRTPTPPPAPTSTTTTFSGSVSSKRSTKTFGLSVGNGNAVNALSFNATGKDRKAATLRLRIIASNGAVLADVMGPSVVNLTTSLGAGAYTWEVSGTSSASFTLQVTYPLP